MLVTTLVAGVGSLGLAAGDVKKAAQNRFR
jgi:hypothetical protein